jgi:hypothetical protein
VSVQAQVEGIGTLEFPDGTDPSVVQATVKRVIASRGAPKAPTAPKPQSASLAEDADIGAAAVTGGIASLAGGIVKATGYGREAVETALTGHDPGDASEAAARLEHALTWTPQTERGKAVMADVSKGLKAFEDWSLKQGQQAHDAIRAAGDKAAEVAKGLGAPQSVVDFIDRHKEQVAAAYGAATAAAPTALATVAGGELAKLPGRAIEAPAAAAPLEVAPGAARPPMTAEPGAPATAAAPAPAPLSTTAAPRAAPSTIGEGPLPPQPTINVSATARAQAYVRDRLGLSWDALGSATKAKLERIAADARALDKLNPEAVKRQATLESLRVPIKTTAGKLNRDPAQLLREQGAAATPSGQPIRDIDVQANRDLRRNVEVLIDRLKGVGQSRAGAVRGEKAGEVISGTSKEAPGAVTKLQRQAKARTKAAYEEARKTDPEAKVAADPMYEFVKGEPDVLNPMTQHIGWLRSWLNRAGIEKLGPDGEPIGDRRPISAIELDDLRKLAGERAGGTGDSAHYAGKVLGVIDKMFDEGLPASADKWKAARQAHAAERGEFANQGAIARLVETKGGKFGSDPKTALEDVWKVSVKNASLEDVRTVKRTLLSGRDAATRLEGKRALRTLRASTAQNLLDEITKNVSTNERGDPNITAESINNWVKGIGQDGTLEGGIEKLNVVWGKRATADLLKIREAAQITKTEPTVRNVGSNTFQKILNWMDDTGFGSLVKNVGGGPLVHLAEMGAKQVEKGAAVRTAGETATSAAERAGAQATDAELRRLQRSGVIKTPPTYQGDRQ